MNVVSFGGGTNSAAMIIGMYLREIPIDLILFADTGGERRHTYDFIEKFDAWLTARGLPEVTFVQYHTKDGERLTLEQECLKSGNLPSIAYGFKKCSLKHKIGTQEKFCNHDERCKAIWKAGGKVDKYIGYDAGETRRIQHAMPADEANQKYKNHYPLYSWGWTREECVRVIERAGLPKPGKSSCFFCLGDYCVACVEAFDQGRPNPIHADDDRVVRCDCFRPIPEPEEEEQKEGEPT